MRRRAFEHFDLVVPAVIALAGTVEILAAGYQPVVPALATFLLASALLIWVRRRPLATPPLVALVYATTPLFGFDVSQPAAWLLLVAFACFAAGMYARRRGGGLAWRASLPRRQSCTPAFSG